MFGIDQIEIFMQLFMQRYFSNFHAKYIPNFSQNKMNLFVLSGHGSESFAAFLNEVILQTNKQKRGIDHCISHHNTSRECFTI